MIYKKLLYIIFAYSFCINTHQIIARYTLTDFNKLLSTEIAIYDNTTTESIKPLSNKLFRLPGIKLVQSEQLDSNNQHVISRCRITLIPVEIFAMYLLYKICSSAYKYSKEYKSS